MVKWVVLLALLALVFGLFVAAFRKRYQGDRVALVCGVVASVGGTVGIALPLAQMNGITLTMSQVVVTGSVALVCTLGGLLYSETRHARSRRLTDSP